MEHWGYRISFKVHTIGHGTARDSCSGVFVFVFAGCPFSSPLPSPPLGLDLAFGFFFFSSFPAVPSLSAPFFPFPAPFGSPGSAAMGSLPAEKALASVFRIAPEEVDATAEEFRLVSVLVVESQHQ